ncbi:MAG: hypothetical protein J5884_00205 [Paludibacteraceae bacterium]|nr:hypothetical protein [Paludibacteraceae bacterium]
MRTKEDLTPVMVEEFMKAVDGLENVDDVLFEFKEFERLCIKGLYERFYKKFPYNANSKLALHIDASERKIRYIVNN